MCLADSNLFKLNSTFLIFSENFCGRRKWWFRNPEPKPTPFASSCDKCCSSSTKVKVDFYHYGYSNNPITRHGAPRLCSIDLRKPHEHNANGRYVSDVNRMKIIMSQTDG